MTQDTKLALLILLPIIAWIGNALYAFAPAGSKFEYLVPALVAVPLIIHAIWHGRVRYGSRVIGKFILIIFAVGWAFETLSVITGVPFGRYHYTDAMAPFIGHIPVFVLPAYALMGYASWSLASLMLDARGPRLSERTAWVKPIVAAALMVVWDLSMDPLRATVEGRWVWIDGGSHAGVPISNYIGWFAVTWVMFMAFAMVLRRAPEGSLPAVPKSRRYWLSSVMAYAAFSGEYLLNPFTGKAGDRLVEVNGAMAQVQAIYDYAAVFCAVTLVPVVLGCVVMSLRTAPNRTGKPVRERLVQARLPETPR